MATLRLALLGPPRVERDGAPLEVDTRKAIALLAYLAVTGQRQSRDGLAALLWPDYDRAHARGALRRTLSALGTALGGGWLERDRATVGIHPAGLWFDVWRFHELVAACAGHGHPANQACPACVPPLAEAVALHRGGFMDGFALRDSPSFEDWQFFEAEDLRRGLAGALARLADTEASRGRWEAATASARRLVALDPLHEPAHRQLMQLYAWSGDRAAALRQYRECVRVLDRELGVAPLEETTALYQAITEHRTPPSPATQAAVQTGGPAPAADAPAPPATRPDGPLGRPEGPLVGRAESFQAVLAAYAAAERAGRLVVVEGEAGIGKTRLADELAAHVRRHGGVTLATSCYAGEADLAYGPIVAALRAGLATGAAWADRLPAHVLGEVSRLLPELAERRPELPPAPPLDRPGAQARFLDSVSSALLAACGGPAPGALVLDDLHWADEASLDVLAYLVHRLPGQQVLLLVTWRPEQVPRAHRLRRLVAEAQRAGTATVVRLGRLTRPQVAELVAALAPAHAGQADHLFSETEGLPFFLMAYLAAMAEGEPATPGGVRALLETRLAAVSQIGAQVLAAAAAIGRSFDVDTVREASGRSDEETVAALEELTERGLVAEVTPAGDRAGQSAGTAAAYDFSHDKLRALVYDQTSLARRRLLHRRVAEALRNRARGRPDPDALASSIAHQFQLAGQDAQAAVYARLAGDRARALYANREAIAHYRTALALGHADTAALHEAVGDLATLLGDYDTALREYETAAAHGPADLAGLEHKLGNLYHRRGDWDAADSHFDAARAALAAGDTARQALLAADVSLTAHRRNQSERALQLAELALALAEAASDPQALAQAHNILGVLATHRGDPALACAHLERSLALAATLPDPSARVAALNNLALARGAAGQLDEAVPLAEAGLALCASQGDRHREAALHNNLADLLHAVGRFDEAMRHLKQAVAIFAEVGESDRLQPEIWKLSEW